MEPQTHPGAVIRWVSKVLWRLSLVALPLSAIAAGAADSSGEEERPLTIDDFDPDLVARIVVPDPDRELPWQDGERLVYTLGWSLFEVGTTELLIESDVFEGEPVWRFTMTTRTNAFADRLYRVRNMVTSIADDAVTATVYFSNDQREGSRERDYEVTFDMEASEARYYDRINDERHDPVWIFPGSFDPFGITLFVRSLGFEVGDRLVIPTTNGREPFLTDIQVRGVETRRFRLGRQEAYVLEPDIKDVGGVFRRSSGSSIRFWFTKDRHRYPIRMESSVAIGSFWAELVRVERPHKEDLEADIPRRPTGARRRR